MKKRGFNQIDWVVSLGIFLLYLAWFFIFLKPYIQVTTDLSPFEGKIRESLRTDLYYEVTKYPVFIQSEKIQNSTIVFLEFNKGAEKNFMIDENPNYFFFNNKLLTLVDFNNSTNYFWILESSKNYTFENRKLDINRNNNTVTTSKQLLTEFENGLLKNLSYKNTQRIKNAEFKINLNNFTASRVNITEYNILSEFAAVSQPMTLYTRVIAKNSVIWFEALQNDKDAVNSLIMHFQISGFEAFFSDNNNYGNITYTCQSYESGFLKLYNDDESLSFILPKDTGIIVCKESANTAGVNITIPVESSKEFFLISGGNDFESEDFRDYNAFYGVKRTIEGIDGLLLHNMSYEDKKNDWQVLEENNFQVTIWNSTLNNLEKRNTTLLTLGNEPLTTKEVFVDEYRDFILDNMGELSEVTVSVKTW
jgi:hypothetical protein